MESTGVERAGAPILNAALESMPYGFSIWDDNYRLVLVNSRYAQIYGLPGEQIRRGMSLLAMCELTVAAGNHPGLAPDALYRTYRDRLIENSVPGLIGRYETHVGGRVIKASYMRMPGLGWVATHEDITEDIARMQALHARETALELQNMRLHAAVDNMPQGLCMFDRDHRLVVSNSSYAAIYGLPPELVRPGTLHDDIFAHQLAHSMHRAGGGDGFLGRHKQRVRDRKAGAELFQMDDGRTIALGHHPTPDGGWVSTHVNITERIRRDAALQQHNIRFEAAVNNMPQGLCMFDAEQRLIICNDHYADMYGLPPELVKPGTLLADIVNHRHLHGTRPVGGAEAYLAHGAGLTETGRPGIDTVELEDGRVISILHHPMADGGWVSTHQDVTEQRSNEMRVRHLARHDSLTDLPNRLMFRETMEAAKGRIDRGQMLAVFAIDLDHFKSVNDSLGHAAGDAVLSMVADRLRASCRESDIVARLGGDEFAVLSAPLDRATDAAVLAARVVQQIGEPFVFDGHNILIGASIGIAVAPGDGNDADALLNNADLALYRAKNEGRGAFHFFEPGMDAALQKRRAVESGLRQAIANNEFRLVFQPLFNLEQNRICGLEALLRWYHPERGTIGPAEFVPIAEETGLIVPISAWVLHESCAAAARWPDHVCVSVNLSTLQFRNRRLIDQIKSALAGSGLDPARLQLEITESLLLIDGPATLEVLQELRALGVRIAMDDFGTGYSSLGYLRTFPFDKIKIDQSFVKELSSKADSRAIVTAMIALGRSLGIATIAEGIETEDQLDLVRAQGCTEVQGFLFSPPLPSAAIDKLFAEHAGMEEWTRSVRRAEMTAKF